MLIDLIAQVNAVGPLMPWLLSLGVSLSSESELEKNVFICHLNIVGRFGGDDVGIPYNLKILMIQRINARYYYLNGLHMVGILSLSL